MINYLSIEDIHNIIRVMNEHHGTNVTIMNKGQLRSILEMPKLEVFGHQQYPELYQKAAKMMELLIKRHVLSDENKRCAMMAAESMIRSNNATLIVPLKAIRLCRYCDGYG